MKTVVGLFERVSEANNAVEALEDAGFDRNSYSVMARDEMVEAHTDSDLIEEPSGAEVGAGTGAVGGTVLGGLTGLLISTGALVIPGIGPVLAAGTLASTIGTTALGAGIGAGVGAVTGGLVGALIDMGVPEADAHFYAEGVKRGGILVVAQADDNRAPVAATLMRQANAMDVETRRETWQASGWRQFDETVIPARDYPRL